MPSNRLSKVTKHIVKKKGKAAGALHEGSRDAKRVQSASAKDDRLHQTGALRHRLNKPYMERVNAFKAYTLEHTEPCPVSTTQSLIEDYLGRYDEELAALQAERRAGRPPSTRETLLKQHIEKEDREYISGFWVPDLADAANLVAMKGWNGSWQSLSTVKFVRVTKSGLRTESVFPPKGMS